jgi:hypothetical protein
MPPPVSGPPSASLIPTQFILAGTVDEIDARTRRLRIGLQVMDVILPASLEELRTGDPVVVHGIRDPTSGRVLTVGVVRSLQPGAAPSPTAVDCPESLTAQRRIVALVISLLVELRPEVQILECRPLPMNDRYAIRLEIPREIGKAVLIRRRLLERALLDPAARDTVRNMLHTTVQVLRSQRAISGRGVPRTTSGCGPGRAAPPARDRSSPRMRW